MSKNNSFRKNANKQAGADGRNTKPKTRDARRGCKDSTADRAVGARGELSPLNDIAWYSRNPELLAAAARIPYPYKPGMSINFGNFVYTYGNAKDRAIPVTYAIPGIARLDFAYSVGYSSGVTSPASIAAKEMYGRIRSKFSGALDEDAPDLFMYCIALDSAHAYIAYLKRVYRALCSYTPQNRLLPEGLLKAMGFEDEDIIYMLKHKAEMWGVINTLVHMVNKFSVPDNMDLYKRHRWMNENVYLDEPRLNAQMFIFNPTGFYQVSDSTETGTALIFKNLDVTGYGAATISKMYDFGSALISALSEWDDSYTINGHIERAYEGEAFYKAELLQEGELLTPAYVEEVLTQIENFTGVGDVTNLGITQDPATNAVIHKPTVANITWNGNMMINLHKDNPEAADTVIASRLMAYAVKNGAVNEVHAGTEIPMSVQYFKINDDGTVGTAYPLPYAKILDVSVDSVVTTMNVLDPVFERQAYQHAPMAWIIILNGSTATAKYFPKLVGDASNLTALSTAQLDEITRVCVYSELNCFN